MEKSFKIYNSITTRDQLVQASRVFKTTWQQAYRTIFPQAQLQNLDEQIWQKNLLQPGRHNLIAVDPNNKVVGVASYGRSRERNSSWGELMAIYILPEYQGQELGKKLLEKAEAGLRLLNYNHYLLWVLQDNHYAMRFYHNNGWYNSGIVQIKTILGKKVKLVQFRK
ncbi:GNAT family N-acetyltransferase [Limosilactobacillus sp. STM2_1]|uniref:GNAT family N-acetyltransferase n=1 Tax=Limosilactobacillus rudii TaxID=2759755 RepID=A0A7W3ULJ9_9LACO|nr:GNAT family N-acetyltransferase [Limosilactobacillus rudii]MBB1079762.1 GNAT family N-acetyltransferase [Limosilactobacillus rudii]MBB1097778.1 GNAT family N-acetyltransferase [Limosilactobacillus rudii]MCD7134859.1 GNAT family N-acetyltransferase [Limosilactobacillus rudii]